MLFTVIIFIIVLLTYFHLMSQFNKSEDMEIYETDFVNNSHLQDICDLRQPVLFDYMKINPELFSASHTSPDSKINVNVKDVVDIESGDSIILPYSSTNVLMKTDNKSRFFSENNAELADNKYPQVDHDLMPRFVVNSRRDIMFGSNGATTPMRYHTEHRNFICVKSGRIQVKMTPWKSHKYLYLVSDYEHYEFRSPINVWDPQDKYKGGDLDKIKFLEFDVNQGHILYIPPYWFYTIKYVGDDTQLYGFNYNSLANCVANFPKWGMYYLQQQNLRYAPKKASKENVDIAL